MSGRPRSSSTTSGGDSSSRAARPCRSPRRDACARSEQSAHEAPCGSPRRPRRAGSRPRSPAYSSGALPGALPGAVAARPCSDSTERRPEMMATMKLRRLVLPPGVDPRGGGRLHAGVDRDQPDRAATWSPVTARSAATPSPIGASSTDPGADHPRTRQAGTADASPPARHRRRPGAHTTASPDVQPDPPAVAPTRHRQEVPSSSGTPARPRRRPSTPRPGSGRGTSTGTPGGPATKPPSAAADLRRRARRAARPHLARTAAPGSGSAGRVVAECSGSSIELVGAQANSGWTVEVGGETGGTRIEVHFHAAERDRDEPRRGAGLGAGGGGGRGRAQRRVPQRQAGLLGRLAVLTTSSWCVARCPWAPLGFSGARCRRSRLRPPPPTRSAVLPVVRSAAC